MILYSALVTFPKDVLSQDSTYIEYYNLTNEAERHYDQNNLFVSEKYFDSAFTKVNRANIKDVWLYCSILNQTTREKKARKFLIKYLKYNGVWFKKELFVRILSNYGFSNKPGKNKKLLNELKSPSQVFGEHTCEICSKLDSMHVLDQKYRLLRKEHVDTVEMTINNELEFIKIEEAISLIDSSNSKFLKQLINSKELEYAGHLCPNNLYHLLLHMNGKEFYECRDVLFQYVRSGQLNPWDYACVYDRHQLISDSCTKFFAYPLVDDLSCTTYKEIIQNRRTIGLSTFYTRQSWGHYIKPGTMMKFILKDRFKILNSNNFRKS